MRAAPSRLKTATLLVALFAAATAPHSVDAQAIWGRPMTGAGEIGLEWVRPNLKNGTSFGATRGIWVPNGRYRLSERQHLVFAVPFLRTGNSAAGSSTIGDPYIGYESIDSSGKSTLEIGVRFPMADGSYRFGAELLAFEGDYDRFEEALPKTFTVHAEGQDQVWRDQSGADVRIRLGATLLHSTGSNVSSYDANAFLFDYGLRFGRLIGDVDLSAALTGRLILSGSGGDFGQRSIHQVSFEVAGRGPIAPRIGLRLPIDQPLKSVLDGVVTVGVTMRIE